MTNFKKSLHSDGHFDFASVPLPFCFRFPSVMQVNLQSTSKDSKDLWNFSLENPICLWNAFKRDHFPKKLHASVLLPFSFRFASVMLVK